MTTHLKRAVLAIDPGGSKCDAVLVRDDGTVMGWGHAQKPGISGRSPEMVNAAITDAIGPRSFDDLLVAAYVPGLPSGINPLAVRGQTRVWPLPGKKLVELADVVLDNGAPCGDATVEVPGFRQKVGPLSSVTGCALADALVVETVQLLVQRGMTPPVFMSANLDGGDAFNAEQLRIHRDRIHYL